MADDKKRIDQPTGTETVGHEWDGIEELNTPLPRWWLWTLYATIVWGIAYTVAYPAWPMISEATAGVLNWSSRGELDKQLAAEQLRKAPIVNAIAATPIEQLESNPQLMQAAVEGGRAAFRQNCVQCHGSGAAGSRGYPNLNDDDWLWGGDIKAIHYSIEHGIRNPGHDQTRTSQMPAFGRDGLLQPAEIDDLTAYVRAVSRQQPVNAAAKRGAALYQTNCAACHGNDARGNREFGAPNLTDAIWLYGGDEESVRKSIHDARFGVMPRWGGKLDQATTKMLAAYVHSLGGGERQTVQLPEKKK
ncbi:MAG TPA: cytochrome-c oxidase, cbb3-type subunit III [Sphingomicrobium sp.]|nr:cytochrome-c oxidase, cbb3-type subunit III [Sphingomicrobium sp.]